MKYILLIFGLWSGGASAQVLTLAGPSSARSVSLTDLKRLLKSEVVTIQDPVFKRQIKYDAFPLSHILALVLKPEDVAPSEIRFGSLDGYSPTLAFSKIQEFEGYLAYREHGRKALVAKIPEKGTATAAPFYVVWKKKSEAKELPWVYQLTKIESIDWNQSFAKVIPKGSAADSPEMKGLALFRNFCIRCHQVNGQGGDMGPELNSPNNVTEYFEKSKLKAFITDAPKFRAHSKMPTFNFLKSEEIDQLVAYLTRMAAQKK